MMISNNARNGFDHLLMQAIKASMTASSSDACEVTVLANPSEIGETKIVIFTISSYLFRAIVLIYFTPDDCAKEYFSQFNRGHPSEMTEQSFFDAIAECGNMCCGTLNRELSQYFPHLGMSTPNFINSNCSFYLDALKCGHIQHFKIEASDTFQFHASLGICHYADLDFILKTNDASTPIGELELF